MEYVKLNPLALGYASAIIGALFMLLLSIAGVLGFWLDAVKIMQSFHFGYALSAAGIIAGIIEDAAASFVFGYLIAYLYNRLSR